MYRCGIIDSSYTFSLKHYDVCPMSVCELESKLAPQGKRAMDITLYGKILLWLGHIRAI